MSKARFSHRFLIIGTIVCACAALAFWASTTEALTQPPLLDRELFFGDPLIANAQISPGGTKMAFLRPSNNTLNVWIKKTEEPFSEARPITHSTERPIHSYSWSRDGRYILFMQDQEGNENFHLYAVDTNIETAPRDLTPFETVRVELLSLPKNNPNLVYVGLNDRDERYHDVYRIDIPSGERTLLRQNNEEIADWVFDRTGHLRLAIRTTTDGSTEILRVDTERLSPIWSCSIKENVQPFAFHRDGRRLYMATDKGSEEDLSHLVLLDVQTGDVERIESDPENEVDFESPVFSARTDELVATTYVGDRLRVYFKNTEWENDFKILKAILPDGEISLASSTKADDLWIVCLQSDTDPETAYLFDRKTKKVDFLYRAYPFLPSDDLCHMQSIVYTARDGLQIHGYLTLPKGKEAQNLPLVVYPHGGPWARDTWGYDRYAQLLANRGYAVVQINFRGSTGYGKKFVNAGNKAWGDAMQDDITDGVDFLVKQHIVDPARIAIFGGSYGGYATLAGLAFTPQLYAAGISYVGPSNLLTLLNSLPAYWVSGKSQFNERVGDPSKPEDAARLHRQSPLFSAQKIVAPLLVVQGAHDPRVKKAESDQIVIALRTLGRDVEYIVAPDEGHGFAGVDNRMAFAAAMEKFLAKHLGGRYQKEVPESISERLTEITVDVQTVALENPIEDQPLEVDR